MRRAPLALPGCGAVPEGLGALALLLMGACIWVWVRAGFSPAGSTDYLDAHLLLPASLPAHAAAACFTARACCSPTAVDGVFEEGGEEEETDELVGQVLDEIGINLNASLVSAPGQKVAAAAPAAAVQQPIAQPMGAAEGGWAAGWLRHHLLAEPAGWEQHRHGGSTSCQSLVCYRLSHALLPFSRPCVPANCSAASMAISPLHNTHCLQQAAAARRQG